MCGIGIAQWTYKCAPSAHCSNSAFKAWTDLQKFSDSTPSRTCKRHPLTNSCPWFRYWNQVHFIWAETAVNPYYYDARRGRYAGADLEDSKSLCQATNYWEQEFEGPQDPASSLPQRFNAAKTVLKHNHGGTAPQTCHFTEAPHV